MYPIADEAGLLGDFINVGKNSPHVNIIVDSHKVTIVPTIKIPRKYGEVE